MLVKSVRGYTPAWGEDCFIAENATLIGDVVMGDQCSICLLYTSPSPRD